MDDRKVVLSYMAVVRYICTEKQLPHEIKKYLIANQMIELCDRARTENLNVNVAAFIVTNELAKDYCSDIMNDTDVIAVIDKIFAAINIDIDKMTRFINAKDFLMKEGIHIDE